MAGRPSVPVRVGYINNYNKISYEIIADMGMINGFHYAKIRFLQPNIFGYYTEIVTRTNNIKYDGTHGSNILDPYGATYRGVGCNGNINISFKDPVMYRKYRLWSSLIDGVIAGNFTIDKRWLCFEYFIQDLPHIEGYEEWTVNKFYEILRDAETNNITLETAKFVHSKVNKAISNYKRYSNDDNYIGIKHRSKSTYEVYFRKNLVGIYSDPIAAASIYNHFARANGYPEYILNKLGNDEMSILEANKYKRYSNKEESTKQLYTLLDYTECSDVVANKEFVAKLENK